VLRTGRHPYVLLKFEGSFPLGIYWDGRCRVRITVSKRWQKLLRGQCGNYNEDGRDDFTLRDDSQTSSADVFANNWEHTKTADDCGVPQPALNCSVDVCLLVTSFNCEMVKWIPHTLFKLVYLSIVIVLKKTEKNTFMGLYEAKQHIMHQNISLFLMS